MGLGFKQADFTITGAWDFNEYAVQSYKVNVGDHVKQTDIRDMKYWEVPTADVWTFGFPCQDLSIANTEGEGLEGERSGMFYEVMRLLEETLQHKPDSMPKVIMAENVKGLKPYLPVLADEYSKRGYTMLFTRLDSQNFSVPQHRERYFVVGIRFDLNYTMFRFPDNQGGTELTVRDIMLPDSEVEEKFYLSEKAIAYMNRERKGKPRWEYHTNPLDGVAATVTANSWKGVPYLVLKTERPRRLTPREVARLQGFPDTFKFVVSNTRLYEQFGNAVSVTVSNALAKEIKTFLQLTESE